MLIVYYRLFYAETIAEIDNMPHADSFSIDFCSCEDGLMRRSKWWGTDLDSKRHAG